MLTGADNGIEHGDDQGGSYERFWGIKNIGISSGFRYEHDGYCSCRCRRVSDRFCSLSERHFGYAISPISAMYSGIKGAITRFRAPYITYTRQIYIDSWLEGLRGEQHTGNRYQNSITDEALEDHKRRICYKPRVANVQEVSHWPPAASCIDSSDEGFECTSEHRNEMLNNQK